MAKEFDKKIKIENEMGKDKKIKMVVKKGKTEESEQLPARHGLNNSITGQTSARTGPKVTECYTLPESLMRHC